MDKVKFSNIERKSNSKTQKGRPLVRTYVSASKLSSYLVSVKLYPVETKLGSFKCNGKRCKVCKNILETDTITCSNDETTYKKSEKAIFT